MNLRRLNLNLLVVLDALLTEQHVSRAANRLGITQPALSNNLNLLRALFKDPLLVRTKSGMQLTVKAQQLISPVREIMVKTEQLLSAKISFDPKTQHSEFIIGLSDYTSLLILPALLNGLSQDAPHIRIKVKVVNFLHNQRDFENGNLHLAIGHYGHPPESLISQHLYTEHLVAVMSKKHHLAKKKLTLRALESCRHITVTYRDEFGGSNVEEMLYAKGVRYKPSVRIPFALAAYYIAANTDLLLIAPDKMTKKLSACFPCVIKPLPFDKNIKSVSQYWHAQYNHHAGHQWLRQYIKNLSVKESFGIGS